MLAWMWSDSPARLSHRSHNTAMARRKRQEDEHDSNESSVPLEKDGDRESAVLAFFGCSRCRIGLLIERYGFEFLPSKWKKRWRNDDACSTRVVYGQDLTTALTWMTHQKAAALTAHIPTQGTLVRKALQQCLAQCLLAYTR